jgi:outer membrane cobalamin receptor
MADAGVKLTHRSGAFLKLGGFYVIRDSALLLEDTYVDDDSGEEFTAYENKDLQQYGLELELQTGRIRDLVTLYFTATAMDSRQREAGQYENRIELPDYIITGGVYADWRGFDCNLFGKFVSGYENKRFAADRQYHDLGDFVDLNLTFGYTVGQEQRTRVYVALENLLDDEYSSVVGYPDDGFKAFVGLQHEM